MRDRSYICQADGCNVDLKDGDSKYYKRHKVCVPHAKSPVILVNSVQMRFCQQCSRVHELSLFDGIKKSCRESLAGHNERRRKTYAAKFNAVRPAIEYNAQNNDLRFSAARNFLDLNEVVLQNLNHNPYSNPRPSTSSIFSAPPMLPPPSLAEMTLQMFPGTKHFHII